MVQTPVLVDVELVEQVFDVQIPRPRGIRGLSVGGWVATRWRQDGDKTETRRRQDGKQEGAKVRRHVLGKVIFLWGEWDRNKKKKQKEQQQKTTRPTRTNQEVLALIC